MYAPPCPLGGDRLDLGQLLVDFFKGNIGIGLDLTVSAGPAPLGRPDERVAALDLVKGSALVSRGGLAGTPVVVVDSVASCLNGTPGTAHGLRPLVEGGSRGCDSGHCEQSRGEEGSQLHFERVTKIE